MAEIVIGGTVIEPGQRQRIELPAARLYTQNQMNLPVEVLNGAKDGPSLWLSAAIHGDEINGVEIIDRVLEKLDVRKLHGSLVAVPVLNVFGFIQQQRYMPDRRDLNRCFPGSANGSLASRLAHLFMNQIVANSTHGIDLHTASNHRTNLPQIRANLKHGPTRQMAEAFGAPVMIQVDAPRGSLRHAVAKKNLPVLTYEAGEPLRFNSDAINIGVKGVLRVMAALGIRKVKTPKSGSRPSIEVTKTTWVRARRSGILRLGVKMAESVVRGQVLGELHDVFGDHKARLRSPCDGLVIGHTHNPLVSQGDAIIHVAAETR